MPTPTQSRWRRSGSTTEVDANEGLRHRRSPLASLAPHQPRPARDAARAMERGGVAAGQGRAHEGARAEESDSAGGVVQLIVTEAMDDIVRLATSVISHAIIRKPVGGAGGAPGARIRRLASQ